MVFSKAGFHGSVDSTDPMSSVEYGPIGAGNLAKSGIPVEPAVKSYKSVNPLNERVNGEMGRNTDGTVKRAI